MYIFENITFLFVAVAIMIYVLRHVNEWARKRQEEDVRNADKMGANFVPAERWGSRSMFNINRLGIIFMTLVLLILAYAFLLGS